MGVPSPAQKREPREPIWGANVVKLPPTGHDSVRVISLVRGSPFDTVRSGQTHRTCLGVIPEAAEPVKAGFVVVVTVFSGRFRRVWACGTRSRGPGAAPAAQRGRTAWTLARMTQY
jgi:hypothetical protein